MKAAVARQAAKSALEKLGEGLDPRVDYAALEAAEKAKEVKETAKRAADRTELYGFNASAKRYLQYRVPRKQESERSRAETKRIVENILVPALGSKALDEITLIDVNAIIDPYIHRGQDFGARSVFERIRSIFKYALERGEISGSPILNMATPGEKISRARWLDQDEIKAVWTAATALAYPFGDFVKLTFALGGQRRDDVAEDEAFATHRNRRTARRVEAEGH